MARTQRYHFLFLGAGHFFDHLLMLVFATVSALSLAREWGMSYGELVPYATPGFVAFGVFALPAGWLADRWSREGMLFIFFLGIGLSAVATALAETPLQMATGLFFIGVFAAIYHPVGLALVVQGRDKTGLPLAINGIFGNLGVACAPLVTGFIVDHGTWRQAFVWPGGMAMVFGVAYGIFLLTGGAGVRTPARRGTGPAPATPGSMDRGVLVRLFAVIFFSTAVGGLVFQSTTFALPKIFDERLGELATSATLVGWYTFLVFAVAACGQLVVGMLVDRYSVRTVFAAVAALQAMLFAGMRGLSGWGALLVAASFMLVVFGQIPINDVLVARATRSDWRSRIYAVRYVLTFSVMALSVPLIAWLHAHWGFDRLFLVLAGAAACILAAVLMLPERTDPKVRRTRT